jgi:hypothetical protein
MTSSARTRTPRGNSSQRLWPPLDLVTSKAVWETLRAALPTSALQNSIDIICGRKSSTAASTSTMTPWRSTNSTVNLATTRRSTLLMHTGLRWQPPLPRLLLAAQPHSTLRRRARVRRALSREWGRSCCGRMVFEVADPVPLVEQESDRCGRQALAPKHLAGTLRAPPQTSVGTGVIWSYSS